MKRIISPIIVTILTAVIYISCNNSVSKESNKPNSSGTVKVYSFYSVKQQPLPTVLQLPAQLNAFEAVSIYPKVNGYVKDVLVDIGTNVKQGQVLMKMEAPEVEQNSLGAYERYNKSQASFEESRDKYLRLIKTAETLGAVSPNDLLAAKSKMQSDSAWSNSEKASWKSMESMKDYLIVRAPFDGTITQRNIDPGALVTIGKAESKPMLELKQTSKLRLQANVPETYATQLRINDAVSFTTEGLPGKKFTGVISRQASNLDEKFRNETVEVDVLNIDHLLIAGMYAEVLIPLQGHDNAFLVPQSAVVTSTERKYVIKAKDNKALLVDVRTGNEDNGMIEVFGELTAGDIIIANATDEIKPNQVIR